MASKNSKSGIICLCLTIIFASCRTAPRIPDIDLNESTHVPLESGGLVYLFADAKRARPVIDLLPVEELKDTQTRQILDRTDFIAAVLFPRESGRRFQVIARGNFPAAGAGMLFSFHRDWEKYRLESGGYYWHSEVSGLSIAMNSRQAFIVSSANSISVEPVSSSQGAQIPQGFGDFSRGSPLSLWFGSPAPMINRMLAEAQLPIQLPVQGLFINLYPLETDRYEALLRLQFENVSQARGVTAMLSLARSLPDGNDASSSMSLLYLLTANPPVQNGRNLDIKTDNLSQRQISLLLEMFLLY
jgi:hypothetical protein